MHGRRVAGARNLMPGATGAKQGRARRAGPRSKKSGSAGHYRPSDLVQAAAFAQRNTRIGGKFISSVPISGSPKKGWASAATRGLNW